MWYYITGVILFVLSQLDYFLLSMVICQMCFLFVNSAGCAGFPFLGVLVSLFFEVGWMYVQGEGGFWVHIEDVQHFCICCALYWRCCAGVEFSGGAPDCCSQNHTC